MQALIRLADHLSLTADVLICPGDLSHRISQVGFMQSWDHLRELQAVFKAKAFLSTLGNHDVDSQKLNGEDPFFLARTAHPDFPLGTGFERDCFWANGFYSYDFESRADFLILNTVIDHHDEKTAKRGTFGVERISVLEQTLARRYAAGEKRPALRIAVLHHHPALHSSGPFGSQDVLAYGDQLLSVFQKFGYRIVIHGHRHDPRMSRLSVNGSTLFLLAVGSFAKFLKQLASRTRNLFHHLTIFPDGHEFTAQLRSWEFNFGDGWNKATINSAAFPHVIRFSTAVLSVTADQLDAAVKKRTPPLLLAKELRSEFPQLSFALPTEMKGLQEELHSKFGLKLVLDSDGTIEAIGLTAT